MITRFHWLRSDKPKYANDNLGLRFVDTVMVSTKYGCGCLDVFDRHFPSSTIIHSGKYAFFIYHSHVYPENESICHAIASIIRDDPDRADSEVDIW